MKTKNNNQNKSAGKSRTFFGVSPELKEPLSIIAKKFGYVTADNEPNYALTIKNCLTVALNVHSQDQNQFLQYLNQQTNMNLLTP